MNTIAIKGYRNTRVGLPNTRFLHFCLQRECTGP